MIWFLRLLLLPAFLVVLILGIVLYIIGQMEYKQQNMSKKDISK